MSYGLLLLVGLSCPGQVEPDKLLAAARKQAQEYARHMVAGDHDKVADLSYAPLVELVGGRKKWLEFLQDGRDDFEGRGLKLTAYDALAPKEVHQAGADLIAFVPVQLQWKATDTRYETDTHLIASSSDKGKTWTFIERAKFDDGFFRRLYPKVPKTVTLPPAKPILEAQRDDAKSGSLKSTQANFQLRFPKSWRRALSGSGELPLNLWRDEQHLQVTAEEVDITAEKVMDDALENATGGKPPASRPVARKVGGIAALFMKFDAERAGEHYTIFVTTLRHQGITYRIVGLGPKAKSPDLEAGFSALVDSLTFIGDRKEWLAANVGTTTRTVFLAGLASFELNRPRWQEITFDDPKDYNQADTLRFQMKSRAWINVAVYRDRNSATVELDELQNNYNMRLQKFSAKRVLVKGPKGPMPGLEMTGEFNRASWNILGTVFVKHGFAIHLSLECQEGQRTDVQKDWDQLIHSFRLEDPATHPPLFHLEDRNIDSQRPNPRVAAILKKATVVVRRQYDLHSISPDGKHALLQTNGLWSVQNLSDGKRQPLPGGAPQFGVPAAWSRDGKRLAYASPRGFVLHTFGGSGHTEVPSRVAALAFLKDDRLLAVVQPGRPDRFGSPRFVQHKLVRFEEDGDDPKTLVEFPLARFAHLAVAPDGKQLALVSNQDSPRTAFNGGHLYVAQIDGSKPRQLTKENETIRSVAWSEDGRSLYVVRRLTRPGDDINIGSGYGPGDLYRISVDTGEAVNLSRCGKIEQAWVQADHVLVRISAGDLPPSQNGVFKVAVDDLVKASSATPEPKQAEPREQARKLAAKIKSAFPKPVEELIPNKDVLAKLAGAFATAATDVLGEPFDFSAASLDTLPRWADWLEPALADEPALVYGLGAYYGETLRKVAGAEWHVQPQPLGKWLPGRRPQGNAAAQVVLPLSEIYRFSVRLSDGFIHTSQELERTKGQKLVMVYPPSYAVKALDAATPKNYQAARVAFDKGDTKIGLELLAAAVKEQPANVDLALEAIDLGEAANMPALTEAMVRQAVEAGCQLSEYLVRHADTLAKSDPAKALVLYKKAVNTAFVPFENYVKLGKQLIALDQRPLAECCFRRAYWPATDAAREEIRQLLGMPKGRFFDRP